ncbi:superoxide dismutase [Lactifluus subvellereus]|nr:superoxide dismutase [Lactifluus subvellereus]
MVWVWFIEGTFRLAVVVLSGDSAVTGTVVFEQSSESAPVIITENLSNIVLIFNPGPHSNRPSQLGDATNERMSVRPHFNPFNKNHGAPTAIERHMGDLGNIQSDTTGAAIFTPTDSLISLNGTLNVIGRAVVLHAGTDDLGHGANKESLQTSNSGARAACGVIGET